MPLLFRLDALKGESQCHGLIVLTVVGHTGTVFISIFHGRESGSHGLKDVRMGGGIMRLVEVTMELEGGAESYDGVAVQTVLVGSLIGAFQDLLQILAL